MTATRQLDKTPEKKNSSPSKSPALWISAGCLIVILIALWWNRSGRDLVVKSVNPFRVVKIDSASGTMTLVRGNHTYVVRCAIHCAAFHPSTNYSMEDQGDVLNYTQGSKNLSFPIIEEETTFDAVGGHG